MSKSDKATGEGSSTEFPSPPQQIDEPITSTDDEPEKLGIPSETKLQSATSLPAEKIDTEIQLNDFIVVRRPDENRSLLSPRERVQREIRRMFTKPKSRLESKSQIPEEIQWEELPKRREKSMPTKRKLKRQRQKAREIYREALHSTRDTITLVAILIATFTYTAGVSPPGGVHQEGPLIGTSVGTRKTAFRVFSVCNNVALFTSLCIVLVLVSIIPFKRKALMRMLAIAHKAIWVAVSFMATAYVAAAAVIMQPPPRRKGMDWTTAFLLSICAGSLGTAFVGLGIMLIKHRVMKRKWRKQHARRRARGRAREKLVEEYSSEDYGSSTTISDMAISRELGYHSY